MMNRIFPVLAIALMLVACSDTERQAPTRAELEAMMNPPGTPSGKVVVYTALDRQFSEPILKLFEERTGIEVQAVYDAEAVKTVGLVNRLLAERRRPVADVFWNNEIIRSIQLKNEGLTRPIDPPSAADIPPSQKDPDGHWVGFAARARVIMVNTEILPDPETHPDSFGALTDPQWRGRAGFAKPTFGTTATHAAMQWADWGPERAAEFWRGTFDNAVMLPGNAQARDAVADGELAWCMTDTDDAYGSVVDGKPVRIIYPTAEHGVILLPNTVVGIANSPNPAAGDALINFLVSAEVEQLLAESRSAQIPVRPGMDPTAELPSLDGLEVWEVDWNKVAESIDITGRTLDEMMGN